MMLHALPDRLLLAVRCMERLSRQQQLDLADRILAEIAPEYHADAVALRRARATEALHQPHQHTPYPSGPAAWHYDRRAVDSLSYHPMMDGPAPAGLTRLEGCRAHRDHRDQQGRQGGTASEGSR